MDRRWLKGDNAVWIEARGCQRSIFVSNWPSSQKKDQLGVRHFLLKEEKREIKEMKKEHTCGEKHPRIQSGLTSKHKTYFCCLESYQTQ